MSQWPVTSFTRETVEEAIVSDLRRATGRFPDDDRLAELIVVLNEGSERFATLWAEGAVGAHREDRKVVAHPLVGPVVVDCDVVTDGEEELKIVIMTAVPGSEDETRLRLAVISGVPDPVVSGN